MLRSFSLIETLASILLLSIIISNFLNFSTQSSNYQNHNSLQNLQNEINTKSYTNFSHTKVDVNFDIENNTKLTYIDGTDYSTYTYSNNLKLISIDIPYKEPNLLSKNFE